MRLFQSEFPARRQAALRAFPFVPRVGTNAPRLRVSAGEKTAGGF
jgi:hypothetical protein